MIAWHSHPHSLRRGLLGVLIVAAALAGSPFLQAETVKVPVGEQGRDKASLQLPKAGMKQSEVRDKYGKPMNWTDAVGDPPISSWIYPEFVVYFEYNQVLHAVVKHSPQDESGG